MLAISFFEVKNVMYIRTTVSHLGTHPVSAMKDLYELAQKITRGRLFPPSNLDTDCFFKGFVLFKEKVAIQSIERTLINSGSPNNAFCSSYIYIYVVNRFRQLF